MATSPAFEPANLVDYGRWNCSAVVERGCTDESGAIYTSPAIGVFLSLFADSITPLSFTLQKYVHNRVARLPSSKRKHYTKIPLWWLGNFLLLGGEVCNFIAYSFAPAAIVAPMGAIGIAWNAILARAILKEKFRIQDLIGCLLNVAGILLIIVYAPQAGGLGGCPLTRFASLAITAQFLGYTAAQVVATIIVFLLSLKWGKKHLVFYTLFTALIGSVSVITSKAVAETLAMIFADQNRVMCQTNVTDGSCLVASDYELYYLTLSCDCMGTTNISTLNNVDSTSHLMKTGVSATTGLHVLAHWQLYVVLLFMGGTGFIQIMYMNKSMQNFDNNKIVPTFYVMFITFSITGSAVLYNEFGGCYDILHLLPFCGGVLLVFIGVWVISYKSKKRDTTTSVMPLGGAEHEKGGEKGAFCETPKPTLADKVAHDEDSQRDEKSDEEGAGKELWKAETPQKGAHNAERDTIKQAAGLSPQKSSENIPTVKASDRHGRDNESGRSSSRDNAETSARDNQSGDEAAEAARKAIEKEEEVRGDPLVVSEEEGVTASVEGEGQKSEGEGKQSSRMSAERGDVNDEEETTRASASLGAQRAEDESSEDVRAARSKRRRGKKKVERDSNAAGLAPLRGGPRGGGTVPALAPLPLPPLRQLE